MWNWKWILQFTLSRILWGKKTYFRSVKFFYFSQNVFFHINASILILMVIIHFWPVIQLLEESNDYVMLADSSMATSTALRCWVLLLLRVLYSCSNWMPVLKGKSQTLSVRYLRILERAFITSLQLTTSMTQGFLTPSNQMICFNISKSFFSSEVQAW